MISLPLRVCEMNCAEECQYTTYLAVRPEGPVVDQIADLASRSKSWQG